MSGKWTAFWNASLADLRNSVELRIRWKGESHPVRIFAVRNFIVAWDRRGGQDQK
jgi:hypothetical protein